MSEWSGIHLAKRTFFPSLPWSSRERQRAILLAAPWSTTSLLLSVCSGKIQEVAHTNAMLKNKNLLRSQSWKPANREMQEEDCVTCPRPGRVSNWAHSWTQPSWKPKPSIHTKQKVPKCPDQTGFKPSTQDHCKHSSSGKGCVSGGAVSTSKAGGLAFSPPGCSRTAGMRFPRCLHCTAHVGHKYITRTLSFWVLLFLSTFPCHHACHPATPGCLASLRAYIGLTRGKSKKAAGAEVWREGSKFFPLRSIRTSPQPPHTHPHASTHFRLLAFPPPVAAFSLASPRASPLSLLRFVPRFYGFLCQLPQGYSLEWTHLRDD